MFAIGNMNAALPINTNANNIALTPTEVPGLNQIIRVYVLYKSGMRLSTLQLVFKFFWSILRAIYIKTDIPCIAGFPFVNVQGIHTNIKEYKGLCNEWNCCKCMPETIKQYTDYDLYIGTIEASFLSHTYVEISNFNQLSLSLLSPDTVSSNRNEYDSTQNNEKRIQSVLTWWLSLSFL